MTPIRREAVEEILYPRIRQHESLRLHVYDDATGMPVVKGYTLQGHPTIGYGRLLTGSRGISIQEAESMMRRDVEAAYNAAVDFPWFWGLNAERQAVIVEMVYNMGLPRFRGFRKMIAALDRQDYELAAAEMLDSLWRDQVGRRAVHLAEIMRRG